MGFLEKVKNMFTEEVEEDDVKVEQIKKEVTHVKIDSPKEEVENDLTSINLENLSIKPDTVNEKLLLHACCGPCALEPYRILKEAGWDITIMYSNDNIYPENEYKKRFDVLKNYCEENDIKLVKDNYNPESWNDNMSKFGSPKLKTEQRKNRCGACYLHRLENAAKYAKENSIKYISSTLAVSPYQFNDLLKEKLEICAKKYKLNAVFMDFRPYYKNATKRSIEIKMYRQKYCGCQLSFNESKEQFKKTKNKKYLAQLEAIEQSQ